MQKIKHLLLTLHTVALALQLLRLKGASTDESPEVLGKNGINSMKWLDVRGIL